MLIDERLQMQEGRRVGVTADQSDVTKILAGMAEKNQLSVDGLATALGKAGVNIKTLTDRIKAQIVWQEAVGRKFRRDVQIADADIDKAVAEAESGGEGAAAPENTLQLRQVKFELSGNPDQRTLASRLAEAEALRTRFESCSNVAELAKGIKGASVKVLADQQPGAAVGVAPDRVFSRGGVDHGAARSVADSARCALGLHDGEQGVGPCSVFRPQYR
jgi:peptidyl-prolyl cis-trans isomerase SurA